MKKLCSLFAALLFAGSMMAVTITPDNCGWSTTAGEQSGVVEGVTVATNQGVVGTASSVTAMRIYKTKTLTISAASNITKIEFTCTAKGTAQYGPGCFAAQTGYTFEESGNKGTWEGSATSVTFTAESNQVRATQIVVTLEGEGGDTPSTLADGYYLVGNMNSWTPAAAYKFAQNTAAAEGVVEYMLDITFAANAEFKVRQVANGEATTWFPAGENNNCPINDAGEYTVYFRPNADGGEDWFESVIFNQKHEAPVVTPISLTQFLVDKPTTEVTLKDLTVIFATNKSTYVIDEDGVALVMYDANKTYYDGTLTAGKVLSGQKATYYVNKNQDEIIPTNAAEVSDGVAPVPTLLNAAPTEANINRYISYQNVAATADNNKYYIFEDVQLYGATATLKPTAEGNYDVEGIYIVYNGNTPEIIVTAIAESSATGITNTATDAKAIKTIENGIMIIEMNGIRYNAFGQIVK